MMTESLFVLGQTGHDVTLWILVALSVVSLSIIIERFLTFREIKKSSDKVSERIREILKTNDQSKVEHIAEDWNSLEGRALNYGMRHIGENGVDGLDEMFDSYSKTERPRLEKNLNFLATVGSNAPFIGLLGTVFGIMHAFQSLSNANGDPSVVMVGISQALIATAIGLMVALPAVISYNFFQKQVKNVMMNLETVRDMCVSYAKTHKN